MAQRTLKFRSILPSVVPIRTGRPVDGRIAETFEMLDRTLAEFAAAIVALQTAPAATTGTASTPLILTPDVIVLTTPSTIVSSPIPIVNGAVLVLRIEQDATGGRLMTLNGLQFTPSPTTISKTALARTTFHFAGIAGMWVFLGVADSSI